MDLKGREIDIPAILDYQQTTAVLHHETMYAVAVCYFGSRLRPRTYVATLLEAATFSTAPHTASFVAPYKAASPPPRRQLDRSTSRLYGLGSLTDGATAQLHTTSGAGNTGVYS
jgi:hypothetical protein